MSTVAQQQLRSAVISGSLYQLDPAATGAVSSASQVSFPALTLTAVSRKYVPETTQTATVAVPAAPASFGSVGWRMTADIVTLSDAGRIPAQTINVSLTALSSLAVGNYVFTAILFAAGTEVGRGTLVGGVLDTIGLVAAAYVVPVTVASTVDIPANARMELAVFLAATNLSATTAATVTVQTNGAASSVGAFSYSINASRSASQVAPVAADSASRTYSLVRISSEATAVPAQGGQRVVSATRISSDALPTAVDSAVSQETYPRIGAEAIVVTDSASRTQTDFRRASEVLVAAVDSASRLVAASRTATQTDVMVATATKQIAYGRSTLHQFAPGDAPLVDPTRSIAGIIRNNDNTPYLGGALVYLVRNDNVVVAQTTSSAVDGSYAFLRNSFDSATYYVAAFTDGATPREAVTERGLVAI